MADNLPTVTIPQFSYDVKPMDIGEGYAKGITAAGEGIAKGLHDVLDVATRNQNVNDSLQAMNQNKILSDEAYKSVASKSLGAKESMLGLYAGEWIKQQAQERELQKIGYTGAVTYAVEHGKLLDSVSLLKAGVPVPGFDPKKMIINPQTGQPQTTTTTQQTTTPAPRALPVNAAQPVQRAQLVTPPAQTTGAPTPTWTMGPNAAPPLPKLKKFGPPLNLSEPIPPGATHQTIKLADGTYVDGILRTDGTFQARPRE
jgi:hypothetical protein